MKTIRVLFRLFCGIVLFSCASLHAQVTILTSKSGVVGTDRTFTTAELGGFDPAGADKLVVTATDENASTFTSVTYAGQSLKLAVERSNGGNFHQIWYLDYTGAPTQGDLVLTGGSDSCGVSVLALANAADGFVAKASASSTSIGFDPLYNGSAVIAGFACNGDGDATAHAPLTPLLNGTALGGGSRGGSGYAVLNAGNDTFSSNVPNSRPAICIVSFAALGVDTDSASITSTSAVDDGGNPSSGLNTDPVLTLNFDEAIFPGTGSILLKKDGGDTVQSFDVSSASQLSFGVSTLTIRPDVLEPETSYFIQIPSGAIEDGSGNTTSYPDATLTFTTGSWLTISTGGKSTYTTTDLRNFDPTGYDKLVAIVMDENGAFPSGLAWGASGNFTPILNNNNSNRRTSMWYLDGPFTTADSLTVSGIGSSFGVSLIALSGTVSGDPAASSNSSTDSINFTTTSTDSIVVAGITDNGGADINAGSPLTTYFNRDVGSSAGGSGVTANTTAGVQTFSFTGATSSPSLVIAEFAKVVPTPYEAWIAGFNFSAYTNPDLTPSGNPDGDANSNFMEFAFGFDPTVSDGTGTLTIDGSSITENGLPQLHTDPSTGKFFLRYTRRVDYVAAGITYTPQFSHKSLGVTDFEDVTGGGSVVGSGTGAGGVSIEAVAVEFPDALPISGRKARFGRVEVTETP